MIRPPPKSPLFPPPPLFRSPPAAVVAPPAPQESRIARRAAGAAAPVAPRPEHVSEVQSRNEPPHWAPAQVEDRERHGPPFGQIEPDASGVPAAGGEGVGEVLIQERGGGQRAVGKRPPLRREARPDGEPEQRGGPEQRRGAPRGSPAHRA